MMYMTIFSLSQPFKIRKFITRKNLNTYPVAYNLQGTREEEINDIIQIIMTQI